MCRHSEGGENKVDGEISKKHPAYNGCVGEESVFHGRATEILDGNVIVRRDVSQSIEDRVPEGESSRVESVHCAN